MHKYTNTQIQMHKYTNTNTQWCILICWQLIENITIEETSQISILIEYDANDADENDNKKYVMCK